MRIAMILLLVSATMFAMGCRPAPTASAAQAPKDQRPAAPEFPGGLQWLNTDRPFSLKELRGKIVLLDFWTYCCINCMHVIPDLKKLEAKYPDELFVIGVHSAKFNNEKDTSNIREAIIRYELEHPVINDKDFLVWKAFEANSWPTLVLIDPDGKAVGYASGEGNYEILDKVIGDLIKEYGSKLNRKRIPLVLEKENKPKSVLSYPGKIAADEKGGRLFFTDSNHNRVIVASLAGAIQGVIGEGSVGFKDGDYATAQFFRPQGIAFDSAGNSLYIADTENHAIRKIDLTSKKVTTLAGNGQQATYPPTGGVGVKVSLSSPWDVLLKGDSLFIAMAGCHQIWKLDLKSLRAEPYAGTGRENIQDGPLAGSLFSQPSGITTDGTHLFVADSEVSAVRQIDPAAGSVKTIIGTGLFDFGDVDGKYPTARLQHCIGAAYHNGFVYVADTYNHKIRRVDPKTRSVETFIGTGKRGMADGPAKAASLNEPNGLVVVGGKFYIADTNNHMIRVFNPASNTLSTLKLTNLEKLATRTIPGFHGKEFRAAAQEISPSAKSLELVIQLPKGTKFNKEAPFKLEATSDKPDSVRVGPVSVAQASNSVSIPISAVSGEAVIQVTVGINYCSEGNNGLCYFKEARITAPVKVTPSGSATPRVTYTL